MNTIILIITGFSLSVLQGGMLSVFGKREQAPMEAGAGSLPHETPGTALSRFMAGPRAAWQDLIAFLSAGSRAGLAAFIGIAATAIISGIIVLFIDLPVPLMVLLSIVSCAAILVSAGAARARFFRKNTAADPVPAPSLLPETPAPAPRETSMEEVAPAEIVSESDRTEHGYLTGYWVSPPYSSVKIVRQGNAGFTYQVLEPPISAREKTILRETYAYLRDVIIYDTSEKDVEKHLQKEMIYPVFRQFDAAIPEDRLGILYYYLRRDLSGYGPLEVLMRDPALEDMSCNGKNLPVFIFHRVYGSLPTSVVFSEGELNQFVQKLAQKANKQISLSNPMIDATLPDGARVQITYSDVVSTKGSSFTIRKFRDEPMTPLDLINLGTFSTDILAFLWLAIEHHKSLIVAGGTASGKTSTMNAVSLFIPQNAKIVSLEDTREIQLPHKNWLPTQTRELNLVGVKGEDIDLFSLLKASMRQRPEYIIVGEVRGSEAQTLFQAMNTGHATLSTLHAGSVQEAINRLTHDPINVPSVMFTALDLVVIQAIYSFGNKRIRRCLTIHEILVDEHGAIHTIPLYEWDMPSDSFRRVAEHSRVLEEIRAHRGWTEEEVQRQLKKREEFFTWALEVRPPDIHDLANAIHDMSE